MTREHSMAETKAALLQRLAKLLNSLEDVVKGLPLPGTPSGLLDQSYFTEELNRTVEMLATVKGLISDADEHVADFTGPFPVLDGLQSTIKAASEQDLAPERTTHITLMCSWYNKMFSAVVQSRGSAIPLALSLMRPQPSLRLPVQALQQGAALAAMTPTTPLSTPKSGDETASVDQVAKWLDLILSPAFHREPEEYYIEREILERRPQEYKAAAVSWAKYAETYWNQLEVQITTLFSPERRYNLMYWLIECLKEWFPSVYRPKDASGAPTVDIADAVCQGRLSPLHIAAALGMPSLCLKLLDSGCNANEPGRFGVPLICAMLGENIFQPLDVENGEEWLDRTNVVVRRVGKRENNYRERTICTIVRGGGRCVSRASWGGLGQPVSIFDLAFWAALKCQAESILAIVLEHEAVGGLRRFESELGQTLSHPKLIRKSALKWHYNSKDQPERTIMAALLTCIFDHHLALLPPKGVVEAPDDVIDELIEQLMVRFDLQFCHQNGTTDLPNIPDDDFDRIVRSVVICGEAFRLRRLVEDGRLKPDMRITGNRDGDTLLHMAVSNDDADCARILLASGGSPDVVDNSNRSVLMVAESENMIDVLAGEHDADTTHTDNEGRTVYHLFAATNDDGLLRRLCRFDASLDEVLVMENSKGHDPLAVAMLFIENTARLPMGLKEPLAARILLKEEVGLIDRISLVGRWRTVEPPLTHIAAAWGELELVKGLEALRADFCALDKQGLSPLHHLNFSASATLIDALSELCGDAHTTAAGITPAEAMFKNLRLASGEMSAHPSCRSVLSAAAFDRLLTPETLAYHDEAGRGLWARFARMFDVHESQHGGYISKDAHVYWDLCFGVAATCMGERGAFLQYERETGKPAIAAFFSDSEDEVVADATHITHRCSGWIQQILAQASEDSLELFRKSSLSLNLLACACIIADDALLASLMRAGVCMKQRLAYLDDRTPIEWATEDPQGEDTLSMLIGLMSLEYLEQVREDIFYSLYVEVRVALLNLKVELFTEKGLKFDAKVEGIPMVYQAMMDRRLSLTVALLGQGVDTTPPEGMPSLLFLAASTPFPLYNRGGEELFLSLLEYLGPDEPWRATATNELHQTRRNALQVAAANDNEGCLSALLKLPEVRGRVNDVSLGNAAMHEAARAGASLCLATLLQGADADVAVRGYHDKIAGSGYTPLHLAVIYRADVDVLVMLLEEGPGTVHICDDAGRTALDWAVKVGNQKAQELLKRAKLWANQVIKGTATDTGNGNL
jgi:ankyrin repeat protein